MKNICIVTTGHPPFDERIYWKFALSFKENGFNAAILCSTLNIAIEQNGIIFKGFDGENISKREKINKLIELLNLVNPDLIICSEPLAVLASRKYVSKQNKNCNIIADITEWYPENVAFKYRGIKRIILYLFLYFFNIYAVNKADALIIGEETKKKRYDLIAPFKEKEIIGYYPVLKYFQTSPRMIDDELVLCYAGLISFERGIKKLIAAADAIAKKYRNLKVRVKFVGRFVNPDEKIELSAQIFNYPNIKTEFTGWTTYDKISELLRDVHICFDLRIRNFIYNNSLPIKIFEYMAAGKPFIYSDVKPIRKEINYESCGQLVNPGNIIEIIEAVERYIKDGGMLKVHQSNGRKIIEEGKNWERESVKLINFINRFLPSEVKN